MEPGHTLCERYLLERELGRGSVGVVFAGRDLLLDREIAVKIVKERLHPGRVPKWLSQAKQTAQLEHPGLVSVFDFGVYHDLSYLVMPLLIGRSLAELFVVGPLPLRLVAELGLQTALALAYGHGRGIVHGNLNPSHIMLVGGREGLQIKILDFGVTTNPRELRSRAVARATVGHSSYLAPEQLITGGDFDARADLYSLGAILYEAAVGRPVFMGEVDTLQNELIENIPLGPRTIRADIPVEFETLLLSLLTKQPQRRLAAARELAEQLEPFVAAGGNAAELGIAGDLGRRFSVDEIDFEAGETRATLLHDAVGRDLALRAIDSRLTATRVGSMQLVLLAGEAGIGKTTLLDELAIACQQRELELLRTRATGSDPESWLGPFAELLTAGLAQRPEAADLLASHASRLVALFPDLARSRLGQLARSPRREASWAGLEHLTDRPRGSPLGKGSSTRDAEPDAARTARERIEDLLVLAFEALLVSGRPLTLAVDDAHLSAETVELFDVLFRRLPRSPLAIVLAYEPAETGPEHPVSRLALRLAEHPRVLRVELGPLDEQAYEQLMIQLVGTAELGPGLVSSLLWQSGGRPLYARELVREAVDSGNLVLRDGVWRLEARVWPIPRQLQASVNGRLRRLPARLVVALRIGAVLATGTGEFDFVELVEVVGYDRAELDFLLTRAVERSLLLEHREHGALSYQFTSEVLRRIVHQTLEPSASRKLHLHCAKRLHRLPFSEELVEGRSVQRLEHLLEGKAVAQARPLVIERAQRALEGGPVEAALAQLSQLLEATGVGIERGELLLLVAELEHRREQDHVAASALQELINLLDGSDEPRFSPIGERGAQLAKLMGRRDLGDRLLGLRPRDRRAAERQRRARAELAALRPATSSRSMQIGDLLLMHGEYTAAREAYDSARRRAARDGDREEQARQLQRLARVSSRLGHYESAIGYCRTGLELLAGRHELERVGLWALGAYAHCSAGFFDRAEGELEAGSAELETFSGERSASRDRVAAELEGSRGDWYIGTGQPQRAITAYERCLSLSPTTERWSLSVARFNLGQACALAGHSSRALREFERAAADKRAIGDRWGFAWTQVARVEVLRDLGQVEAAIELLGEATEIADELSDPRLFALVHTELGRHALLGGKLDQAASEARRIKDMARGTAAARELGAAYELLAAVELARGHLDEAQLQAEAATKEAERHKHKGRLISALLLLAEASPPAARPELLARARVASENLSNPYRELDVSLTSLRLGLGDPVHASDDYVALEQLSDRAERLSAQRHVGLCLLAQAEVLAPHDLRGALDHARLGETQLRVLGAKLEADRAAELIARLTLR